MLRLHSFTVLINFCILLLAGFISIHLRFYDKSIPNDLYYLLIFIGSFTFILVNRVQYSNFSKNVVKASAQIIKNWLVCFGLILLGILFTQSSIAFSRIWIISWGFVSSIGLLSINLIAYSYLSKKSSSLLTTSRIVIVGKNLTTKKLIYAINNNPWLNYQLAIHLPNFEKSKLEKIHHHVIDEIWLCPSLNEMPNLREIIHSLAQSSARIRLSLDLSECHLLNHGIGEVSGTPMIDLSSPPFTGNAALYKTLEDILLSSIFLVALSPILLIIALAVKINSPGPILYKQTRVGLNGKPFDMLKFRTMPVDTERDGAHWGGSESKVADSFSLFLRKYNLDELPQFVNVLKGQMSIVGPRPERVEFIDQFAKEIPDYAKKHLVKAGITGWAQIHGLRGDTDLHQRIEYDLYYIEHWSLGLDLKIIMITAIQSAFPKLSNTITT